VTGFTITLNLKLCFHHHFEPEIICFQIEVLKIPPQDVKAVLLVDNASSHPNIKKLCSHDGKIKCLALCPSTTLTVHGSRHCNAMQQVA
jgi:hypothetical protein